MRYKILNVIKNESSKNLELDMIALFDGLNTIFISLKVQLNECQKSKAKLISTLTEQEGIVKGLQSERREWSTNLANQSSELAREKGSLLAQIEKLKTDLDNDLENRNRVKIKEKELESALEALKEAKLKITKLKTSNEKVSLPVSKFVNPKIL